MEFLKKIWAFLFDSLQTILLAASVFLVIYIFLLRPFNVDGLSMYPTFHNGEFVLTNLLTYHLRKPERGDVVVFQAPPAPDKDYIKRIIGLPGDTVSIQDQAYYVNGQKLDESAYLKSDVKTFGGPFLGEGASITVPADNYFVSGDNRPESSDSREWGLVKRSLFIGTSWIVYWPVDRMRTISNPFKK